MKQLTVIEFNTKEKNITQMEDFGVQDAKFYDKVKSEATKYMVSLMEKAGADSDCILIAEVLGGSSFKDFSWEIVEAEI